MFTFTLLFGVSAVTYSWNDITYWKQYAVLHEIYYDKLPFRHYNYIE